MHKELCILNSILSSLMETSATISEHRLYFSLRREIHAETSRHSLINFQHYRRETDKTDR